MSETQAQRTTRIRAEVAKMRQESNAELRRRTDAITRAWKEGFAALKIENDRLQAELKDWRGLDQDQIQNYYRENISIKGPY